MEIAGPAFTGEIWLPLRADTSVPIRQLPRHSLWRAATTVDGDVIYAVKPRGTSFGIGLIARRQKPKPLILDIDDWDLAFFRDLSWKERIVDSAAVWNYNNGLYTWAAEKAIPLADCVTVSNSFLQKRFGGALIPHFRDTAHLDPSSYDSQAAKLALGLGSTKVVCFFGSVRRHKGVVELTRAVEMLGRTDVTLLIVGAEPSDRIALPQRRWLRILGPQPFESVPQFLAAADVVAIFQRPGDSSRGQLPAKVFDAMAMAKPVVASRIGDLPGVVDGGGIFVEPGDVRALSDAIGRLVDNPADAETMGNIGRQRCEAQFSYEAVAPRLSALVEDVLAEAGGGKHRTLQG